MRARSAALGSVLFWLGTIPALAQAADRLVDLVRAGERAAALAMIDSGVDVNVPEGNGTTALHWAAYQSDSELTAKLLRAGAKPSVTNVFGASPMSEAAAKGDAAVIRLLLEAGADADSANAEGQTALMAVARTGNVEAAKLLLKHGASVNAVEQWGGQTALMWAAAQSQPEMVKLLIRHGADVNARGAVRDWQRRVTAEPRPKDLQRGGLTALLYAAREGCVECARHLVEGGADINLPDPDRVSPLVLAIINFRFDTAAYLISAGADVNLWDLYGRSPLYAAVDMHDLPRGGRPDLPSSDETTALQVAEMLLKAGANPNLQLKLRPPYRNVIYDRGGDNILSAGATPLLRAAKGGDTAAIRLLLQYRPLVDLPNSTGVTPLMAAAGMGNGSNPTRGRYKTPEDALESVRLLAAAGADVNARNATGLTALHSAAAKGWNDVVKELAARGADLKAADENGATPLDAAKGRYSEGGGRGGRRGEQGDVHDETVALLGELIAAANARPGHSVTELSTADASAR